MNSFVENRFDRESIISSSSSSLPRESIDSQLSNTSNGSKSQSDSFGYKTENTRKEKISCSEHFLFLGPLILFLILLISGIVIFIVAQKSIDEHEDKEIHRNSDLSNEDFLPLQCPFSSKEKNKETPFALNELKCGLNRSSIFRIFYSNNHHSMKAGENLKIEDVIVPLKIQFNKRFLSKISTKSFVLILIDPVLLPHYIYTVLLHWIRYFSSTPENEEDICYYQHMEFGHRYDHQKIILLYATNSTRMMIRAKTFCNQAIESFQLEQYKTFIQMKLIASTHFFIPYRKEFD